MSLKEKIGNDMKAAMKSGEKLRLETLRMIRAALLEKEIERRAGSGEVSPEDELMVLNSAAKRRREAIEQYEKGGRKDLVDQESQELAIIQEYLPKQLSLDELTRLVASVIAETGATSAADFGRVMPAVMKLAKGKADGKVVQDVVRNLLGPRP